MNFKDWEIDAGLERMKRELNISRDKKNKGSVQSSGLDEVINKLNHLVGMENVKSDINTYINFLKVQKMRK